MDPSEQTRQLVPLFVEKTEGQDIRNLLYVRHENGTFSSLAELQSSSPPEESAEVPGVLTTSIIDAYSAERGRTLTSVSVSPFRLRCYIIGGVKICFPW